MSTFVADFETTTNPEDCRVWAYAICEVGNSDNVIIGTTNPRLDGKTPWSFTVV